MRGRDSSAHQREIRRPQNGVLQFDLWQQRLYNQDWPMPPEGNAMRRALQSHNKKQADNCGN
jgi:hypothetical protein